MQKTLETVYFYDWQNLEDVEAKVGKLTAVQCLFATLAGEMLQLQLITVDV
jgi:hypothetical protein